VEGVYPVHPVIAEYELKQYIEVMDKDQDIRSFLYAFAACTLNLTRYGDRRTQEVVKTIENLMDYSIESMKRAHKHFHFSVMRAVQSIRQRRRVLLRSRRHCHNTAATNR
jgi:hypothetical protein